LRVDLEALIPVTEGRTPLLDAQADPPSEYETLGARLDNAARFDAAGVMIAMKAKRDFNSLRPIRLNAGTAVAYGLPYQAALRSVTINPARIWGIHARTGSLEVGKDANAVFSGNTP
jgi:imidazolonepropionase-like amidohydrolase